MVNTVITTNKNLTNQPIEIYEGTINQIFDLYSDMVHKLTGHFEANDSVRLRERDVHGKVPQG